MHIIRFVTGEIVSLQSNLYERPLLFPSVCHPSNCEEMFLHLETDHSLIRMQITNIITFSKYSAVSSSARFDGTGCDVEEHVRYMEGKFLF